MKVTSVSNVTNFYTTTSGEFATAGKNAAGAWCKVIGKDAEGNNVLGGELIDEEKKTIRSTVTLYFDTAIKTIPVDANGNRSGEDVDTNSMVVRVDVLCAQLRRNADVSMLLNNYDMERFLPDCDVNIAQTAVSKGESIPNTDATYSKDMYANQIEVVGLSDVAKKLRAGDKQATIIEQFVQAHPNLPMDVILALAK